MPSENVRRFLKKVGIETPTYHPGVEGAAPLPELRDRHDTRLHVLARTVWIDRDEVPATVLLAQPERVGRRQVGVQFGTMNSGTSEIVRVANGYELLKSNVAKFTVIAVKHSPWTPKSAASVLRTRLHDVTATDGMLLVGDIPRVDLDVEGDFEAADDSACTVSDTYTVVAHCVTTSSIDSRSKPLLEAAGMYGDLLNYAVMVDVHNTFRHGHPASKRNYFVEVPYYLEPCQEALFEGVAPNVARQDIEGFHRWVKVMAERRCSDAWPYRKEVHELLEHCRGFLTGSSTDDELAAAMNEIDVQGALLEEARESAAQLDSVLRVTMQEKDELTRQLTAAEERVAAAEEGRKAAEQTSLQHMLRAQNLFNQLDGLKKEKTAAQDYAQKLKAVADGARADAAALKKENDGLRRALRAAEDRARDVVALMRQEDATAPLRAPGSWDELYGCAAQLKNIRMTASAVEPALKDLVHHVQSGNWLGRAWTALTALDRFAAEDREKYPTFLSFSQKNPQSKLTEAHVSRSEGETVRESRRMSAERVFSTEAGQLFMTEHIRIGSGAPPAPRLYFLDEPEEGVVYVGYIGPHLTNTQTN